MSRISFSRERPVRQRPPSETFARSFRTCTCLQQYPVVTEQAVEAMSFSLALELLRKALFAV